MNSYEERQQERKERYLQLAEQAERESSAVWSEAQRMADAIPMGQVIEIRAHFGWKKTDRDGALSFARWMFRRITNASSDEKRVQLINDRHLHGIRFTLEELRA